MIKKPIKKSWIVLAVAIGVGLLAALIAQQFISRQLADIETRDKNRKMVNVIVAKEALSRGTKLGMSNIAVRPIPAEFAHSGAVLPEQFDRIEGQVLAYPAQSGEMIIWSSIEGKKTPTFSARIETGRRAITIPVDEINSISGMLEPGDVVDLMVTVTQKGRKITAPLLQSVTVLATGQRTSNDPQSGEKRQYSTVTFDTTPEQAHSVIVARDAAKITALLRNPNDKYAVANRGDVAALLGIGGDSQAVADGVPVLYGGRGKLQEDIPKLGKANESAPTSGGMIKVSANSPASVMTSSSANQAANTGSTQNEQSTR